jgi:dTDP-4-amino-4,6-dideoxygalactose transaminase
MIRLSKSVVGQQEAEAASKVIIEDGYLGMGAEVGKFEQDIAQYLNIPAQNVVCVNSGTAALHLAVDAIIEPGDEILVPSLTFLSSYQAISASGAIPVSCEVLEDALTIDLKDAETRITSKTKAIMAVHYASNLVNHEELYKLAKKYDLRVIEDAAHAFGCEFKHKKIGSIGDIICFSFDGIKNITSGEGGVVISNDEKVLNIVKDTRLLGIEKDSEKRYSGSRSWDFDVKRQGFRYHMSNIFAAIGRVQLTRLETEFAPKRIAIAKAYTNQLGTLADIKLLTYDPDSMIIPHIFPIRVLNQKRDSLKAHLEENGIPTGIHYKPNHLLSFYNTGLTLPRTEKIYSEILTLPLHPELKMDEVKEVCRLIKDYINI